MMISQTFFNAIGMLIQVICTVILLRIQFLDVVIHGSSFLAMLIIVLVGFSGLFFGLLISCILEDLVQANLFMIGDYILMAYISGEC